MNRTVNWDEILQLVFNATGETLYMVLLAGLFTLLIGLPLGVLLFISRRDGLLPMPRLNAVLGGVVNLGRSLPFVVMLIALIPLTRLVVGTTLGSTAAVVPITIGAFPFFARIVENALDEVDKGRIEAILAMGSSKCCCPKRCRPCSQASL
jgi:D-methionine transport system permease protein